MGLHVSNKTYENTAEETAEVHEFTPEQCTLDEDGEPMIGWYWRIMDANRRALTTLIGPYRDAEQASTAAIKEWVNDTYVNA